MRTVLCSCADFELGASEREYLRPGDMNRTMRVDHGRVDSQGGVGVGNAARVVA